MMAYMTLIPSLSGEFSRLAAIFHFGAPSDNMLSSGRKGISSIPKWTWIYANSLRRASSSSFLKWPSLFGSKTGVQNEAEQKQGTPGRKEYYVPRKFVPMTRKALIRRILEDENLVNTQDRHYFQDLAVHLDKAIAGTFHGVLGELKVWTDLC